MLPGTANTTRTLCIRNTLGDKAKGLDIDIPKHYYINDEVGKIPPMTWRSHSMLLFNNWLNYAVYQETPYDLSQLPRSEHKK